ncbi:MAG: hypothetical protein MJ229_06435 [bacterium]|nr:hypothetical protein [bacterium]
MVQAIQPRMYPQMPQMVNYNAVKIDIHNPQVNAGQGQTNPQAPVMPQPNKYIYGYPQNNIYDMPYNNIYDARAPKNPPAPQPIHDGPRGSKGRPPVPPPVIIQHAVIKTTDLPKSVVTSPIEKAEKPAQEKVSDVKKEEIKTEEKKATEPQSVLTKDEKPAQAEAPKKTVKVAEAADIKPAMDVNKFIKALMSDNADTQAKAMSLIVEVAAKRPDVAVDLLDVKVVDTLVGIMSQDTSTLQGPTQKQINARRKMMENAPMTEAEKADAAFYSPKEVAEQNKQLAIYTIASLDNIYADEVKKMSNNTVPLNELPGVKNIVEEMTSDKNSRVTKVVCMDALMSIYTPEYKNEMLTVANLAANDQDPGVKKLAEKMKEAIMAS